MREHSSESRRLSWTRALEKAATNEPRATESIVDTIKRTSPELRPMPHMSRLFELVDRAETEPVRVCLSIPPRHGKSTVAFHALARAMLAGRSTIFATYSAEFASYQMRKARTLAEKAGVQFRSDSRATCEWYATNGAVNSAVGLGGAVTGKSADLIIVDDPIKGYAEAASRASRQNVDDWIRGSVLTRAVPHTSVFVIHTRWHPDDLIGRLSSEGWEHITMPAILEDGAALWPEERPLAFLEEQRKQLGEHMFAALYQGSPRPRGQELFGAPTYYDAPPVAGYRLGIGVDLAYSSKTSSDYSVAVCVAHNGHRSYVLDVLRRQCSAPDFGAHLAAFKAKWPGARMRAYAHGTELGAIDFFKRTTGVLVDARPATGDKFVRAQATSAAWNRGELMVPRTAPWLGDFVSEVCAFTGVNDPHDDCVDALAAAYDEAIVGELPGAGSPVRVIQRSTTSGLRGVY